MDDSVQRDETRGAVAELLARLVGGDVRALARAVSLVEDGGEGAEELLTGCRALGKRSLRIGVTGAPGVGKSTLVDRMVRELRAVGGTVGVIAVDPTSPLTGGALLGDRIRMQAFSGDDGVFIRSMASRGVSGGIGAKAVAVCAVLEAAGRETIVIETVGVGQDEVAVAGLADVTLLVLVPGMGDDVQSLKAGVMEIADIFVVNKSDQPGAEQVEAEILEMQGLVSGVGAVAPVLPTAASTGEGVAELMEAIGRWGASRKASGAGRLAGVLAGSEIDHLGIAVRSIAVARLFYELLGLRVSTEETVAHEQVKTAMLPLGTSRIELIEPLAEDSAVGRFLARRGEGLHHVAIRVPDVEAMFARLAANGIRLASDRVRVGAGGHRYFFVHPKSSGGVLVELVGSA
jgi:LAO/AO transport system kinase